MERQPLDHQDQEETTTTTTTAVLVDEPLQYSTQTQTTQKQTSSSNSTEQLITHPFRYDTLSWAKAHPFPDPQDRMLGIHTKSSFNNLSSLLDHLDNQQQQQQQQHNDQQPFRMHQQPVSTSPNHSDRSHSRSNSTRSDSSFITSSLQTSHTQVPTITTPVIPSNPTSPLLRLNMNHPAMPTGPSISLTSATPLTAKPSQRVDHFFKQSLSENSPHLTTAAHHLLASQQSNNNNNNNNNNNHHTSNNSTHLNSNYDLFQSLINDQQLVNPHHHHQQQEQGQQHNSFLSPRPLRSRQRSKSESMGNQQFNNPIGANTYAQFQKSFFFNPPTTCPPPLTEFFPISPPAHHSDPQQLPLPSSSPSSTSSDFWANLQQQQQQQQQHTASLTPQLGGASQFLQSSSSPSLDATQPIQQQLSDSSYLQNLLEEFNIKKSAATEYPSGPSSSLLKPANQQLLHRRSHSVSHPAGYRRGRSDGLIFATGPMGGGAFDLLMPPQQLSSSDAYSQPYPGGLSPPLARAHNTNSNSTMGSLQQGLLSLEGTWRSGSFATIDQPPPPSSSTYPNGSSFPAAPSPAISEAALSQYSSRARSYSHSSFESEDTAGSTPHPSFLPLEYRSKTTAATKAAAIRRRKVGVAARYICDMCGESFTRRYNLRGHQRAHKGEKPFACGYPGCNSRFARAHDQKRHYKLHLGVKDYSCPVCRKTFIRLDALQRHHKSDAGQACFQELQQQAGLASASGSSAGHGGPPPPPPPDMGAVSSSSADAPSLDDPPPQDSFHHDSFAFLHSHQPLDLHPQQHQQHQHQQQQHLALPTDDHDTLPDPATAAFFNCLSSAQS